MIFFCVANSYNTKELIQKVFANKKFFERPNYGFLSMNKIENVIMRKATIETRLTEYEKERNKAIAKLRYIVKQCLGISALYNKAHRARVPKTINARVTARIC